MESVLSAQMSLRHVCDPQNFVQSAFQIFDLPENIFFDLPEYIFFDLPSALQVLADCPAMSFVFVY